MKAVVRLLIVDDHERFRAMARRMFESEGFVVVGEAGDGAAAVRAVVDLRPDVVLLDVVLPDTDGFVVCSALAALPDPPSVVMTSSRDLSSFGDRLAVSWARGFVPKDELTAAAIVSLVG